ncbi:unnamed protein product [Rhizophagus irregularis]|nr:unnamed protein product [Rhizophagus irregularis]
MHHTRLISLLLPLISNNSTEGSITKQYRKDYLKEERYPDNIQTTTEYAFGILDKNIWKVKLETLLKMNLTYENSNETIENSDETIGNSNEIIENFNETIENSYETIENCYFDDETIDWYFDDVSKETNKTDDHLSKPCIDTIHALSQRVIENIERDSKGIIENDLTSNAFFQIAIVNKERDSKEIIENDLTLTRGKFEWIFDYIYKEYIGDNKDFSKYGGELLAFGIKHNEELEELVKDIYKKYIRDIKEKFSKYGGKLLIFGNEELVKDIYKKCIEDIKGNGCF